MWQKDRPHQLIIHVHLVYLEVISLDDFTLHVVLYLSQDCKHGDVGLAGSSGSCNEEVLTSEVRHLKHNGLDTIESLGTL